MAKKCRAVLGGCQCELTRDHRLPHKFMETYWRFSRRPASKRKGERGEIMVFGIIILSLWAIGVGFLAHDYVKDQNGARGAVHGERKGAK